MATEEPTAAEKEQLKQNVKTGSNTIICENAEILGEVTIGSGTIVHPCARIIAQNGPIIIGENNNIEERTLIWNRRSDSSKPNETMTIGSWNWFEVDSRCQSLKVGDKNIFECRSSVGQNIVMGSNCVIGAACCLEGEEVLPDNTEVYGEHCLRRTNKGNSVSISLLEHLHKIMATQGNPRVHRKMNVTK